MAPKVALRGRLLTSASLLLGVHRAWALCSFRAPEPRVEQGPLGIQRQAVEQRGPRLAPTLESSLR